ncbi:MAG: hypothetical protein EOP49_11340 [Sphingobacteriales bacterium]|nr:MAG: hypothetical protein EOP49_11340 [Sphingobacteriales bacterium]
MQTLRANPRLCSATRPPARCTGSAGEQTAFGAEGMPADGFLKQRFLPLYKPAQDVPAQEVAEQGFFDSLQMLSAYHRIKLANVTNQPYPYNITLAHREALRQLNARNQKVALSIIADEDAVYLQTKQVFDTNNTLYFIHIMPLFRLLQDRSQRPFAELLLSVCSYFYRTAGIPYYRHEQAALSYYYDMLAEWILDDLDNLDEEERQSQLGDLNRAAYCGDVIGRQIHHPYQLQQFERRLDNFKPKSKLQEEGLQIAREVFELSIIYPDTNVFRHVPDDADDNEDYVIRAEQYIGFVHDNDGWIYDQISDMLNNEFNEAGEMLEPTVIQTFKPGEPATEDSLDFEHLIFPLINRLCYLFNQLP